MDKFKCKWMKKNVNTVYNNPINYAQADSEHRFREEGINVLELKRKS